MALLAKQNLRPWQKDLTGFIRGIYRAETYAPAAEGASRVLDPGEWGTMPRMPFDRNQISTGLPGLDQVFTGLRAGDNVVWQVDSLDDYAAFVEPFSRWARHNGRRLIYFRFAKHRPLCDPSTAEVHEVSPGPGFEAFITQIHNVIEEVGEDAFYVFDSMSDLSLERISDRMLGNFFVLTCPYLFTLNTIAYHVLLRNYHSFHASSPIAHTTQILVDVYNLRGRLYLHPRKVQHRYSPTMHMLHVWE